MELETVWDGVNRGDGSDLLCIPSPTARIVSTPRPVIRPVLLMTTAKYLYRDAERIALLKALAARESWKVKDLYKVCGDVPRVVFHGILQREYAKGTISRPAYGVVALKPRRTVA